MTPDDMHRALDRVIKTDNNMPQCDVPKEDRPVCLELLRLGFIEERTGPYSDRAYWTTTTAGRAEWAASDLRRRTA